MENLHHPLIKTSNLDFIVKKTLRIFRLELAETRSHRTRVVHHSINYVKVTPILQSLQESVVKLVIHLQNKKTTQIILRYKKKAEV